MRPCRAVSPRLAHERQHLRLRHSLLSPGARPEHGLLRCGVCARRAGRLLSAAPARSGADGACLGRLPVQCHAHRAAGRPSAERTVRDPRPVPVFEGVHLARRHGPFRPRLARHFTAPKHRRRNRPARRSTSVIFSPNAQRARRSYCRACAQSRHHGDLVAAGSSGAFHGDKRPSGQPAEAGGPRCVHPPLPSPDDLHPPVHHGGKLRLGAQRVRGNCARRSLHRRRRRCASLACLLATGATGRRPFLALGHPRHRRISTDSPRHRRCAPVGQLASCRRGRLLQHPALAYAVVHRLA